MDGVLLSPGPACPRPCCRSRGRLKVPGAESPGKEASREMRVGDSGAVVWVVSGEARTTSFRRCLYSPRCVSVCGTALPGSGRDACRGCSTVRRATGVGRAERQTEACPRLPARVPRCRALLPEPGKRGEASRPCVQRDGCQSGEARLQTLAAAATAHVKQAQIQPGWEGASPSAPGAARSVSRWGSRFSAASPPQVSIRAMRWDAASCLLQMQLQELPL